MGRLEIATLGVAVWAKEQKGGWGGEGKQHLLQTTPPPPAPFDSLQVYDNSTWRLVCYASKNIRGSEENDCMQARRDIRAVYTRENKPRLTIAAAYIRREHPV